ncbi:MAG TPA: glycoside hydrolase family 2 protein [Kofleriaceae bacterium]|nr:glycoside hydrolase family 2 protein [Kofleriaceae bacterium]
MIALDDQWAIASSARVAQHGDVLSKPGFDTRDWYETSIPATVLGTLVDRGVYPDPYHGTNLREIPGQGPPAQNFSNHPMPDDSPFGVAWWFRKEFRVPADAGPHLRLQLDGVNYRARVWLNGAVLADLVGAYRVHELDVTDRVVRDGINTIAIEITAPSPCDLALTWVDWNPSPPDKNMGVWRDVWLRWSGPVALRDPFVITKLDGGRARVTIAGDVRNASDRAQTAVIRANLDGRSIATSIELAPREDKPFSIETIVDEPRLWWPRYMGEAALYELAIDVHAGGALSDSARLEVGLREATSELTADGHALYQINGKPLLVRGAGWATDLMLRRQPDRDLAQLEYVKQLGLNTIRFEGALERTDFLAWCDREGILVIAGWCCCDCWEKWDRWSEENHVVGAESLRSQIRRVRRHPSMLSWWYGSDFPPPPRVERSYLAVLAEERWPNPHQSSAANKPTEVTGKSGLKMEGPYEYVPPSYWYEDTIRGGAFGFATEISPGAAVPPIESLARMLPREHLWPIDAVWDFHAGGQEFHTVGRFAAALAARYGEASSADEFAQLAQLVTYEGQRAMFEAYTRNKYRATGVIQWMLNNAWPSMIWHLYDHYLRPGGGFFGTQKACEPLHVQYSYDDRSVVVTNQHARAFGDLTVRVRTLDGEKIARGVAVAADGKTHVMTLPALERDVTFVELRLERAGEIVSTNFYWLPRKPDVIDYDKAYWLHTPTAEHADLSAVRRLPEAQLAARMRRDGGAELTLENTSDQLAFFVQLRAIDAHGDDVLPILWSDNYVSLFPGDVRILRATAVGGGALPEHLAIEARGINLRRMIVLDEAEGPAKILPPDAQRILARTAVDVAYGGCK